MSALARLFGPCRKDVWKQLARETKARFVEGTWRTSARVEAAHAGWTVTLDAYFNAAVKAEFTRLRAPYASRDGLRFSIHRRSVFTELGRKLGMQDVEVGDKAFDHAFVIKGDDEAWLRRLFADARLRELLACEKKVRLEVRRLRGWKSAPRGAATHELVFEEGGIIKDVERLKRLFDLFAEALDQLGRLGSATAPRGGT
jgi:hypothetical protein